MVKCKFDYFRKDRRERCYVMEDLNYAMRLMDILQPMVAINQSTRKLTETLEVQYHHEHNSLNAVITASVTARIKLFFHRCGLQTLLPCTTCKDVVSTPDLKITYSEPYGNLG